MRTPSSLSLSEDDVRDLRRIAEHLSSEEATEVYLPLSWLLYLHVSATRDLYRSATRFPNPGGNGGALRGGSRRQRCCGQEHATWGEKHYPLSAAGGENLF